MMNELLEKNRRRFKILTISMWITVAFWGLLLLSFLADTEKFSDKVWGLITILWIIQIINSWVYIIHLGILVKQINKSIILWVLGVIVFSYFGIGVVVSYIRMKTYAIQNGWA
jgi:hypothetical protein